MSEINNNRAFPHRKARLRGFATDGCEVHITRGNDFEIRGGTPEIHANLLKVTNKLMTIINDFGYDLSALTENEFIEVNDLISSIKKNIKHISTKRLPENHV